MPRLEWRRLIAALAATLASVAILWSIALPVYLTNDDVTIRLSLEGRLVPGQPASGYALFTHAALGWAIAWANQVLPSVPLWDLVITSTLVCAVAILAALCWPVLGTNWVARSTVVAVLAVAVLPLFSAVQFTFSATVAGGAAALLAFSEVGTGAPARRSVLLLAGVLLFFGLLVRSMAAAAGAVSTGVLLLPYAGKAGRIRPLAAIAAATVVLYACLVWLDTTLYGLDPDWGRYHRYHWMLIDLLEWGGPLGQGDVATMRASAGWSNNDWWMLARWFGVDPDIHGYSRVAQAHEAYIAGAAWSERIAALASRAILLAPERIVRLATESAPVLLALAALAATHIRRSSALMIAAIVALFLMICVGIETVFKELPFRLFAPLLVCLVTVMLVSAGATRRASSPLILLIALSLVLTIAAGRLLATADGLRAEQREALELERRVAELQRLSPSLLILHADAFPSEVWWRPFRRLPRRPLTVQLGDNNQNPLFQRFLANSKLQPLLRAVCADQSILVISADGRLEPATEYLREHFQMSVAWRDVYSESFTAWRCEPDSQK